MSLVKDSLVEGQADKSKVINPNPFKVATEVKPKPGPKPGERTMGATTKAAKSAR